MHCVRQHWRPKHWSCVRCLRACLVRRTRVHVLNLLLALGLCQFQLRLRLSQETLHGLDLKGLEPEQES